MKYTIEEYVFNDYNASSKARKDVSHFVLKNGFQSLFKNDKTKIPHNKLAKILMAIKLYTKLLLLKKDDILFLQSSLIILKPILKIKAIKRFKIIYLIHDLFSLRYNTQESIKEHSDEIRKDISIISKCDYIIAHNDLMIQRLKEFGCTSYLVSLDIFDYDCPFPTKKRTLIPNTKIQIAFAGHLGKSYFLQQLDNSQHNYQLIIYGIPEIPVKNSIYKGSVDADILPNVIEGHLGLIWEGNYDIQEKDNYTYINNPHKLSMYIVAGMPVIAWGESAAARFIETRKIGFSVNSLNELDEKLTKLTQSDYNEMIENCLIQRQYLIQGWHLENALNQILTNQ